MDDTKKMFRAIINGQSALKSGLLKEIGDVKQQMSEFERKIEKRFEEVGNRFDAVDKRIDTIGKQVVFLEDDAPTREEHEALEKRVIKIEGKIVST
ncbi:MAG: hypothetical protein AAB599_03720 [Patescibacteria group bacterium]